MISFRVSETRFDEIDIGLRRFDAALRFLLEGVHDVDGRFKAHGVDGAIGVAVVSFDQLDDAVKRQR